MFSYALSLSLDQHAIMLSKSLKEIISLLRRGEVSALELCERCLRRAEKVRALNAYITLTPDLARKHAADADQRLQEGRALGPLDGVPVAVKDNFSTAGVRTTCGSRMLADYVPPYTATAVARMQGAPLIGKNNMDEFAMGCGSVDSVFGAVRNPWLYPFSEQRVDDWRISGGSSGGSAVAVATGTAFSALGSDTGGSVRHPASLTGIVGLKPTYGRVSRHGLIPLVNSLDVPGIFGRCVDDVAIVLNVVSGHDPLDSTTVRRPLPPVHLPESGGGDISGLDIGIPQEYYPLGLGAEVAAAWSGTVARLEGAGCRVSAVSLPHTQAALPCYAVLCAADVASNMARYDGIQFGHRGDADRSTEDMFAAGRHAGFNDVVRGRILAGNFFLLRKNYEHYFRQAQRVRRLISEDFERVWASGVDVLLTPATLSAAPTHSEFSRQDNRTRTQEMDVVTQPANLAGIPAVTLPVALSSEGLPVALQLLAPRFHEHSLLAAARWIEHDAAFPRLNLDWMDEEDEG